MHVDAWREQVGLGLKQHVHLAKLQIQERPKRARAECKSQYLLNEELTILMSKGQRSALLMLEALHTRAQI